MAVQKKTFSNNEKAVLWLGMLTCKTGFLLMYANISTVIGKPAAPHLHVKVQMDPLDPAPKDSLETSCSLTEAPCSTTTLLPDKNSQPWPLRAGAGHSCALALTLPWERKIKTLYSPHFSLWILSQPSSPTTPTLGIPPSGCLIQFT